jgi:hypothetical protein
VTPEEFDAHFDRFAVNVVRLEILPAYDVGGAEAERLAAARAGSARPVRSVRTSPWLARIAVQTIQQGKAWTRVRVIDDPPTDYQVNELIGYGEAQAVGDEVLIAQRADVPDHDDIGDFWLFDRNRPGEHAILMSYSDTGRWLGAERCDDPQVLSTLRRRLDEVMSRSTTLNEYLASRRG